MSEASAEKALWAQIERLRDSQDRLARDQIQLAAVVDALRDRVERDGKAHDAALAKRDMAFEEIFRRLNDAETGVAIGRSRWAMAGAAVLVLCSAVTSLVVFLAGKLWP